MDDTELIEEIIVIRFGHKLQQLGHKKLKDKDDFILLGEGGSWYAWLLLSYFIIYIRSYGFCFVVSCSFT